MRFFEELGSLIEQRWRAANYSEEYFPEIAALALAETSPSERISPLDVVRWVQSANSLPPQADIESKFGNPPLTLFAGPRFHIDVYFWLDGTTSIHQHAFSGAFQVLAGSSIHSRYFFARNREINDHFSIGEVLYDTSELLARGDIRRILPGDQFIHSLFHLDRPSATIVVRTYQTTSALPQFNYLKPGLAIDPFFKEEAAVRKVQCAALLLGAKHPEADSIISAMIESSDFHTAFLLLDTAFKHLTADEIERIFHISAGRERFQNLILRARHRHGHLVDLIPAVMEETARQNNIVMRRAYLTGWEHRFFLALILNVPRREMILDLVKKRFADLDPVDTVGEWAHELSSVKVFGTTEPNVTGVDYFDDDCLFVFKRLLMGETLEKIKPDYEKEYGGDEEEVDSIIESFRNSILLRSLLFDDVAKGET
jgi:hypothetical protein